MSSVFDDVMVMVPWLVAHPGATVPEVAEHFGWTPELVAQYVMMASVSGARDAPGELIDIAIDVEGIQVNDTLGLDRPFQFDQMEAACILLGLDLLELMPGSVEPAAIASTRAKLREQLERTPVKLITPSEPGEGDAAVLIEAIGADRQVAFSYWNDAKDEFVERVVSPIRLAMVDGEAVLESHDHAKDSSRSFRLRRMQDLRVLPTARVLPDEFGAMPLTWVRVRAPLAVRYLLEAARTRRGLQDGPSHTEVEVGVREPVWLARLILSSGRQIEVLEPPEFVAEVDKLLAAAAEPYAGDR